MTKAEQLEKALAEADIQLALAIEEENRTAYATDSMERRYWEGQVDAISLALLIVREEAE